MGDLWGLPSARAQNNVHTCARVWGRLLSFSGGLIQRRRKKKGRIGLDNRKYGGEQVNKTVREERSVSDLR